MPRCISGCRSKFRKATYAVRWFTSVTGLATRRDATSRGDTIGDEILCRQSYVSIFKSSTPFIFIEVRTGWPPSSSCQPASEDVDLGCADGDKGGRRKWLASACKGATEPKAAALFSQLLRISVVIPATLHLRMPTMSICGIWLRPNYYREILYMVKFG